MLVCSPDRETGQQKFNLHGDNPQGRRKIMSLPQRPNAEYPVNPNSSGLSKDWVVGFVDGEGCFHVAINKNPQTKFGYQIIPEFVLVQHERDINLLYRLRTFFGCGVVRKNRQDRYCLRIRKLENLLNVVVPFFERHPLKSKKNVDFKKFAYVVKLMSEGKHLTVEGFNEISKIASQINRKVDRIKIESTPCKNTGI